MREILIVANKTIGGSELEAAVTERVAAGPCAFHLLVPIPSTSSSSLAVGLAAVSAASTPVVEITDQRKVAVDRLQEGLNWLRGLGATATGELGATDAVTAVCEVVERGAFDEIVLSTLPTRLSRWLRQDLPCRIGRHVDIPLTIVTARTSSPVS